ncbi:exo-beta-N-acetylmuramidase NamZ family protein [Zhouia amylolytica]|uniref:DUF1343 domain-containing protein n=1 Tax=Zhouia amylolytica AD3 TaxID=1286632 RepID=W2US26_9FLAO|nr:DUF1343 domain-containing protein [Zhouia amylolytica]ETN96793.1 hypothetical protein P278_02190 [Zhouia amylolytica AD3]
MKFKNTFLLLFLLMISCGNSHVLQQDPEIMSKDVQDTIRKPVDKIVLGVDRTQDYISKLIDKKVAVVANQTSVIFKSDTSYTHLVDSLLNSKIQITKVFAPEHGFRGEADAGEHVKDGKDAKTGLPLISLYGSNKKPTKAQLADVDIVVFDIQDVGVRFYTYISTMHYVMEACAENNIPVLVFDRPNPNGSYIDGPTLEKEHRSFLGMHTIPLVHGMTIAEYANMINNEGWLSNGVQCDLEVVLMKKYSRNMEYSLPIRPSPNLPNDKSIELYPSLGFFEGTDINAGRGTEFQFQRYGAPFLDQEIFTFSYTPVPNFGAKDPKHNGELCFGEDLSEEPAPHKVELKWLIKTYKGTADKLKFFKSRSFTLHAGTEELRKQIEDGWTEKEIRATWQEGIEAFKSIRKKYLLYN